MLKTVNLFLAPEHLLGIREQPLVTNHLEEGCGQRVDISLRLDGVLILSHAVERLTAGYWASGLSGSLDHVTPLRIMMLQPEWYSLGESVQNIPAGY